MFYGAVQDVLDEDFNNDGKRMSLFDGYQDRLNKDVKKKFWEDVLLGIDQYANLSLIFLVFPISLKF